MTKDLVHGNGLVRNVGVELRRIRQKQEMTLEDVAKATSFSKMHISKIERGQVSFPLTTLQRIAKALDVSVVEIIEGADARGQARVLHQEEEQDFILLGQTGARAAALCHRPDERIMLPLLMELERGAATGGLSHPTDSRGRSEEWVYVLQGSVELGYEGKTYQAKKGSALCFSSNVPHTYKNVGRGVARFIVVRVPGQS